MAEKRVRDEMSFLDHLEELRWHIIRSIVAIMVFAILAFVFKEIIFDEIILAPKNKDFFSNRILCDFGELVKRNLPFIKNNRLCINSKQLDLISIKMAGQFSSHIIISLIAGVVVAFPYIFWEFWRFIVPALYLNEKTVARGAVGISSFLFLLGVLFGYFVIVPLSVHFLGSYVVSDQVTNRIYLRSYISTLTSIVLAAGIIFELPVLVYFLSKVGLVTPDFLKKYRRHAIVLILILSAIITPPDIFSQVLVCMPLFVLYEIGIAISKRVIKKQQEEMLEDEEEQEKTKEESEDE
jgi:sec-independent protein translocase protein TatC